MLKALKKLFEDAGSGPRAAIENRHLELAAACLLHESKRVDMGEDAREHDAALEAMTHLFGISTADGEALLAEGREKAQRLTSYFAPVSVIKREFSPEQRVLFVEHLWRVTYADGRLDHDEDHYVRKIAHLLYVPNTQCMLARSRARAAS